MSGKKKQFVCIHFPDYSYGVRRLDILITTLIEKKVSVTSRQASHVSFSLYLALAPLCSESNKWKLIQLQVGGRKIFYICTVILVCLSHNPQCCHNKTFWCFSGFFLTFFLKMFVSTGELALFYRVGGWGLEDQGLVLLFCFSVFNTVAFDKNILFSFIYLFFFLFTWKCCEKSDVFSRKSFRTAHFRVSWLVSWYFEPSQSLWIISGLAHFRVS